MSQAEVEQTRTSAEKESADLISNLPDDMNMRILLRLPLKDAIGTSVLSTHWRHQWAKLPFIILDKNFFHTVVKKRVETSDISTTYSSIVDNVLLCHVGPLLKLDLYIPGCLTNRSSLYQWLRFVSQKSLADLTLIQDREYTEELPSSVFFNAGLIRLRLFWCKISTLPPTFTGFPCLRNLTFCSGDQKSASLLESVICNCPQLQNLTLHIQNLTRHNREIFDITVHAPKLEYLYISGFLGKLCLGNTTTNIRTLQLHLASDTYPSLIFSSLPLLQSLSLDDWIFMHEKHSRLGNQGLIHDLRRLKTQTLELSGVPLHCPLINSFALKLLNCFQHLQRLYCKVAEYGLCKCEIPPHMSSSNFSNIEKRNLLNLNYVDLDCVSGSSNEVRFIKVILECTPVLKVLTIKFGKKVKDEYEMTIAMELMQFTRASCNAQIIFKTRHS